MYRIAVITSDPERDWASQQLLEAAQELGFGAIVDPVSFDLRSEDKAFIRVQGERWDFFDAYIVRGFNRQGEIDYQYEVLELLEHEGKLVINSPAGLSVAESKAQTTYCLQEAGLPVPKTLVTQDLEKAVATADAYGTAVVKPLYGSHGVDIERIDADTAREFLAEFMGRYGAVYIQEFIPNDGKDIRAFVVGDEIPAAMYRIAAEGHWKTNVYQGSHCAPCQLTPEIHQLCLDATRVIGLDYTGVDVMEGPDGPVILELNGAPSWHGLSEATDRNVALDVVSHVVRMLDTGQSASQPAGLRRL